MKLATLGDLTQSVSKCDPRRQYDEVFIYIDLGSVDNVKKCISAPSLVAGSEAPSRARQVVREQDVLVATVRPNLNAVALVSSEFDGAIASTGFTVLRPGENLHPAYLYHWVKSPIFMHEMVRRATGASYPAVSDRIVKQSKIPLVSMGEQRRIAGILDRADAIRTKRRASLALFDELIESTFLQLLNSTSKFTQFGDVVEEFRYGTSSKSSSSGYPTLRIPNVVRGVLDTRDIKRVDVSDAELGKLRLKSGDLLFVRSNGNPSNVGRCAVVDVESLQKEFESQDPWIFASYLIRARLTNHVHAKVLASYFGSPEGRASLRASSRTSAGQYNINTQGLKSILVPVPPVSAQQEFAARVETINAQRALVERALEKDEELFASLQSRAFSGEL